MRKLPSPSMSMTVLRGMRRLGAHRRRQAEAHRAQAAAGDPGARLLKWKYWAAHIWCWPTPVVTMVSSSWPRSLDDLPEPLDGVLRQDGVVAVGVAQRLRLAPVLDLLNPVGELAGCAAPAGRVLVQHLAPGLAGRGSTSPTMGTWATLFLLISDGSMSMWTILPCLANSLTLPVTRSSKRTPRASSRSASLMA